MHLMATPTAGGDLDQSVDIEECVFELLPRGTTLLSASRHHTDHLTRSAKLVTRHADNSVHVYLLLGSSGSLGRQLLLGHHASLGTIHSYLPRLCPKPIGCGRFTTFKGYFTLSTFHRRLGPPSDAGTFLARLVKLHRIEAPDGKFGFRVPTFSGEVLNPAMSMDTWEECFTALLTHALQTEEEVNGVDKELSSLTEELLQMVIPRLLRGLKVKPVLVHGDLTVENSGDTDSVSQVMFWRPAVLWGHGEYEMGAWAWGSRWIRGYLKVGDIAEPREEWEERWRLYGLRHTIGRSVRYPGSTKYRRMIKEEVRWLVERFRPTVGEELWAEEERRERETAVERELSRKASSGSSGRMKARGGRLVKSPPSR
ncbi:Fructosamine kinase-domain-containing protein [Pyronema domesticum]|nr:Fructosamine kinase-domain-containing protein [Pyronema domesticum]